MFAPDGKVDIRASTEGHRSVLVPGLVDGLARMHSRTEGWTGGDSGSRPSVSPPRAF